MCDNYSISASKLCCYVLHIIINNPSYSNLYIDYLPYILMITKRKQKMTTICHDYIYCGKDIYCIIIGINFALD